MACDCDIIRFGRITPPPPPPPPLIVWFISLKYFQLNAGIEDQNQHNITNYEISERFPISEH